MHHLTGDGARAREQELRRVSGRPERRHAHDAELERRSRRRRR
ncbi:hypothetical protein [Nocardioides guangzhouensis]|nr:hypothetical protein [Nocardioides guangzhouensis]